MSNPISDSVSRDGLKTDPFAPSNGEPFYFAPPPIDQRLDLIQHLLECSDLLLLVIGEQGSGKTAMINQLLTSAPELWRVYHLEASVMLDAQALLKQIASACGLHPYEYRRDSFNVYLESLQVHLDACERSNLIPVLLVDNAHTLPLDALRLLFSLVKSEGQRARLRIALFCEPQITSLLNSPQFRSFKQGLMHVLDIPGFTAEQTREYLQQRLIHAGLGEGLPFTEAAICWIQQASKGLPGRINVLARQALLGDEMAVDNQRAPIQALLRHKWQFISAAVWLGLFTAVIVINSMIDGGTKPEPSAQSASPLPLPAPVIVPSESGDSLTPAISSAPGSHISSAELEPPALSKAKRPSPLSQSAVEKPEQSEQFIPSIKGEVWLRAQPPTDYVLQLFGAHNKTTINRFLLQYKLRDKVAWFETTLKGKDWYVVVYGPFPDRNQAVAGISLLPVDLQKLKPWPRSIAEIKKVMR